LRLLINTFSEPPAKFQDLTLYRSKTKFAAQFAHGMPAVFELNRKGAMEMKRIVVWIVALSAVLVIGLGTARADEWRNPLGIAYISGINDIIDQYKDNLQADGYITKSAQGLPIGISYQPYYEFDSGLGIGMGLGPVMLIYGDADFFNLPVNVCLRYAFMENSKASVYFRTGVSYNIASGDYVQDSQVGLIGAIGIELMRDRAVGFGIEVGYDSSSIELENHTTANPTDTKDFEPVGFTVGIFAVF
jgi:hypothetical protein